MLVAERRSDKAAVAASDHERRLATLGVTNQTAHGRIDEGHTLDR